MIIFNIKASELLARIKMWLIMVFFFAFPLFFLPFFRDAFFIPKVGFSIFIAVLILILNLIEVAIQKKVVWRRSGFEMPLFILFIAYLSSFFISTPNKWYTLFVPTEGIAFILSLLVITFTASFYKIKVLKVLVYSSFFLSLSVIISFVNITKNLPIPDSLAFIKTDYFTPLGSYHDALIFIGVLMVYLLLKLFSKSEGTQSQNDKVLSTITVVFALIAIILGVYNIIQPVEVEGQVFRLILPPFRESWYAAVEILKTPLTAVFGVGVNNFSNIFTRVKTLSYNQSDLWTISSFNLSANAFLHILTTIGIAGFVAFLYVLVRLYKSILSSNDIAVLVAFVLFTVLFFIFPLSVVFWLLFFAFIIESESKQDGKNIEINISGVPVVYVSTLGVFVSLIGVIVYYSLNYFLAELYFFKGFQALNKGEAQKVFENYQKAVQKYPYIEELRSSFSQVNLLLSQTYIQQLQEEAGKEKPDEKRINNLRQSLNQAVQAAINEAKAVVALNSGKASSWAFLADVYRAILGLAQNADVWAISSYRRAIQLDPLNPMYNLNLGGVLYSLGQYKEASRVFENAVTAKPDWANAYYNLAWSVYQEKDFERAVIIMQTVIDLFDRQKNYDKESYEKAKKELEEFKKQLPEQRKESTPSSGPAQLEIPTPPQPQLEEKLELPADASPESVSTQE